MLIRSSNRPRLVAACVLATALASSATALAQESPPALSADAGAGQETKLVLEPDEGSVRPEGWTPGIAFGATLNLNDSRDVVGTTNGTSFTAGFVLDSELLFNHERHEWRNTLRAGAGTTRAPAIAEFVKTSDALNFESIYLLHLVEWAGPFARFGLDTTMFSALDIRPAPAAYAISDLEGNTTTLVGRRLDLTDPFSPILLKQSLGAFVQPVREEWMQLEARAGLGAQESIIAEGNLAIQDDAATADLIEVKTLDDYYMVGAEAVVNAKGFIDQAQRVSYVLGLGVLVPFVTSDQAADDDRSRLELTTVEAVAGLNAKIFDWASFNYRFTAVRQPLLVDAWQIQNMALLTFAAAFGSKAPVPEEPCDCLPAPPAPPAPAAEPPPAAPLPAEVAPVPAPEPAPAPAPVPPPAPAPAPAAAPGGP